MKVFGRNTRRSRGSVVVSVPPLVYCFHSKEDEAISKGDARSLFSGSSIVCKACMGCK